MTPRTENTVELGGGYATDVGPRLTASWRKPWVNSYGHSLTTSTTLSAPEQTLDFSYRIPLLKNPLEQYYLLQGGFKRTDLNDTKSDTTTLNVARFWDLSSGWQRAINLRWSLDHFTQGSVTDTTMLLYPGVSINRTRQRGGAMPVWGIANAIPLIGRIPPGVLMLISAHSRHKTCGYALWVRKTALWYAGM